MRRHVSKRHVKDETIINACKGNTIENVAKLFHMRKEHVREIVYKHQQAVKHDSDYFNDDIPF